tara:strand:- start:211 stop:900 length:690 start_codon:yes stop_codon:yes gene_type:complete
MNRDMNVNCNRNKKEDVDKNEEYHELYISVINKTKWDFFITIEPNLSNPYTQRDDNLVSQILSKVEFDLCVKYFGGRKFKKLDKEKKFQTYCSVENIGRYRNDRHYHILINSPIKDTTNTKPFAKELRKEFIAKWNEVVKKLSYMKFHNIFMKKKLNTIIQSGKTSSFQDFKRQSLKKNEELEKRIGCNVLFPHFQINSEERIRDRIGYSLKQQNYNKDDFDFNPFISP